MAQKDDNTKGGKIMRMSPRINKEQYEALDTNVMREYMRVYRIHYDNAVERLMKAILVLEEWKEQVRMEELQRDAQEHDVRILTQLLMDRNQEYNQQQQA